MRILIHGLNFSPELTGIGKYTGELAQFLASNGFEVRVVTAYPYYPHWKIANGFPSRRYSFELRNGVRAIRCPLYVPSSPHPSLRVLHLTSFAISSGLALFPQAFWKPDVVISIAPAILSAPFSLLAARMAGSKAWIHFQDFEIDVAQGLGMLPGNSWLRRMLLSAQRKLACSFDIASTISGSMRERLLAMGIPSKRAELLPNWVDTREISPLPKRETMREHLGIRDGQIVVLYSGNMGRKQGLENLLQASESLQSIRSLLFMFCGDGAVRSELELMSRDLPNVRFLDLQPVHALNALLNTADIHVLPQRGDVAASVMPSKLAGMLASGRPVIATAHEATELGRIASQVGIVVPPDDPEALAEAVEELSRDPQRRRKLGRRGREYAVEHWDKQRVLGQFMQRLNAICAD